MGKAPCFGDRALRLSGGFRWAEPHCGFVATSCWIWREGSRHTPNPSSTLHPPPPFFSSSLEKCISVKDIQAGSSLHVFCLQPCSSSFTSSCSQLLPRSSARDLGETLGGRGQEGEHTHIRRRLHVTSPRQTMAVGWGAEEEEEEGERQVPWMAWLEHKQQPRKCWSKRERGRREGRGGEGRARGSVQICRERAKKFGTARVLASACCLVCVTPVVSKDFGFFFFVSVRTYCIAEI